MGASAQSEVGEPVLNVNSAVGEPAISAHTDDDDDQVVTPWEVTCTAQVNYDKVVAQFGCQRIDAALIDRIAHLTSRPPHRFLRRMIFFAHRDLNQILDLYERGEKFYLYTGRGPSSEALHLGHLVPFMFTKYLQDAFKVPLVIQLTDDEKFLWKNLSIAECKRLACENAKDIIACGFDVERTFIFSDFSFVGGAFYENMMEVAKRVTFNNLRGTFGISPEDHIGKVSFPPVQAVPSFASSFPHLFAGNDQLRCLIPCAIDQASLTRSHGDGSGASSAKHPLRRPALRYRKALAPKLRQWSRSSTSATSAQYRSDFQDPYFRMTRDVAPKIGYQKPSLIESKNFPALQGENGKMSASDPNTAIYLTDKPEVIKKKVNKYAFSGGQSTEESHRKYGANLDVDVPIKYLSFFLEDDDIFEHIKEEYKVGNMLTGKVKEQVVEVLSELALTHKNARAQVTEEMVDAFMAVRPLPNMFG